VNYELSLTVLECYDQKCSHMRADQKVLHFSVQYVGRECTFC